MGLDLAMGGLILFSAIRGWLKGFVVQAIRLVGLVAAVYAAAPVRDQIRPYFEYGFPSIKPDVADRPLWWGAVIAGYFVIIGAASLVIAVSRRKSFGVEESSRSDQFAGFGLGLLKGLIAASFVVAALQRYAEPQLVKVTWAEQQKVESYAWKWNEEYHPGSRIWDAPPVQHFVSQIQRMGLIGAPSSTRKRGNETDGEPATEPEKTAQAENRPPQLAIDPRHPDLNTDGLDSDVAHTVQAILDHLPRADPAR